MATPPGGKARALPADFDVTDKRSRVKPTRDFHTGVRNNVVVSKNPSRYGYKLYVKATATDEEAGNKMATDIACALMIEGEHGYMTAKTANESKDGKAKEACLYFTFYSTAGLVELRAILAAKLKAKIAETAGDWNVANVHMTIKMTGDKIAIEGKVIWMDNFFHDLIGQIADMLGKRVDDNTFIFTVPDDDVGKWLVRQLINNGKKLGVDVSDTTGLAQTREIEYPSDADIEDAIRMTDTRFNDSTKYEQRRKRRRYAVTRVLDAFREMGMTEDELGYERVMMYADCAYRRFWTSGEWIA